MEDEACSLLKFTSVDWVTLRWLESELSAIRQAAEVIRDDPAQARKQAFYISGRAEGAIIHIRAQLDPPKPNV
jgi:hypothetical protein